MAGGSISALQMSGEEGAERDAESLTGVVITPRRHVVRCFQQHPPCPPARACHTFSSWVDMRQTFT